MAIKRKGIPSLVLMENAGRSVADAVKALLKSKKKASVCILCGMGNNAGDGFVVARHLWNSGIGVQVFLIGQGDKLKRDAATNYQILKDCRYPIREICRLTPALKRHIGQADIVVDAIFGVGLNREITGLFRQVIESANQAGPRIVAVDIPSGLDGTSGKIYGTCIRAYTTVTFSCPKKGFYQGQGPQQTGHVIVADIGIPQKLVREVLK